MSELCPYQEDGTCGYHSWRIDENDVSRNHTIVPLPKGVPCDIPVDNCQRIQGFVPIGLIGAVTAREMGQAFPNKEIDPIEEEIEDMDAETNCAGVLFLHPSVLTILAESKG